MDLGSRLARLYVVDYDLRHLQPVSAAPPEPGLLPIEVATTMAGRAFLSGQVQGADTEGGYRLWVPVSERADHLGVLEVLVGGPGHPLAAHAGEIGLAVGQYLHSVSRYTDAFELLRRRQTMNLAADMQWSMLLPALAFETREVSIAGTLEPAYDIGGDCFDYAAHGSIVDLCLLDAMGHGLEATMASALALGAYRFGRRQGLSLVELARSVDRIVAGEWDGERFATGYMSRLDVASGRLSWINAGHPSALLIRNGRVIAEPQCEPCLPLGIGIGAVATGELWLEPDDRLLFYTDGAVEARGSDGVELGIERLTRMIEAELDDRRPASQILRQLVGHVVGHRGGQRLTDDVTLVLLHWHPEPRDGA